ALFLDDVGRRATGAKRGCMNATDLVLDNAAVITMPRERLRALIAEVAAAHGVSVEDLRGPRRFPHIVCARHAAMRRVHQAFQAKSFPEIGRVFARDHTTVMYALGRLRKRK